MKRQRVAVAGVGFAGLAVVAITSVGHVAAAATPKPGPNPTSVLLDTMESELHRAMSSLGNRRPTPPSSPSPTSSATPSPTATASASSAQFGAITGSNDSRRRIADVQVRLGSARRRQHPRRPSQQRPHHRPAPPHRRPRTPSPAASGSPPTAATARPLDGYLKVKTEQQVRAKEEDASADFSSRASPQAASLPPSPAAHRRPRRLGDTASARLSGLFKQFPDIFFNNVALEASTETDYFVSSEGARVATPSHVARLVIVARTRAADGMDLFRVETFEADEAAHLPDQKTLTRQDHRHGEEPRRPPRPPPSPSPSTAQPSSAAAPPPSSSTRSSATASKASASAATTKARPSPSCSASRSCPPSSASPTTPPSPPSTAIPSAATTATTTKARPPAASTSSRTASSTPSSCRASPSPASPPPTATAAPKSATCPPAARATSSSPPPRPSATQNSAQMLIAEAKKQGKALRPLLRRHLLRLRRHHPPLAAGLPGHSARRLPRLRRRPPRRTRPRRQHRRHPAGRAQSHPRHRRQAGHLQRHLRRRIRQIPVSAVAPAMLVSEIETQRQAQGTARPPILPPPGAQQTDLYRPRKGGQSNEC